MQGNILKYQTKVKYNLKYVLLKGIYVKQSST